MTARRVPLFRVLFKATLWILIITVVTAFPQAGPDDAAPAAQSDDQSITETQSDDHSITYYIYPTPDTADSPHTNEPDAILEGQPLTMVFHGFRGDHTARSMHVIKEALLMSGVNNVVVVDWSFLADYADDSALKAYHHVRDHGVPEAAAQAARWIQGVLESKGIAESDVHLVGFSLGSHVAGIIGQNFNSSLGRITGLDPPRFGYENTGKNLCLDRSDAKFVNAMHTSGGILSYTESDPIGHVDFFPNGDTVPQKGCPYENPIDIITCSHYMAFALFAESVLNTDALMATKCDNWKTFNKGSCKNGTHAPMGYPTPDTTRGKFYMKTNTKPPYGEDDPDHPIPDSIKSLLVYDTSEAFIQPQDVVNFLTHSGKDAKQTLADPAADDKSGVMKVKGGSKTTTTPDPPSFQSSGSSPTWSDALTFLVTSFAGYNILQALWDWWKS